MEEEESCSHKRHKKHKKKHKRKHNDDADSIPDDVPKPAIKLKIKIGQETLGEKCVTKTEISGEQSDQPAVEDAFDLMDAEEAVDDDMDDTDTDDEQAWMEALEAGELDESGALKSKKRKENKTMTKRQKALADSKTKDSNDIIYAFYPTLSPDQLQRRQQRAIKRRQMAQDKKEKDKKSTVDRLMKKQEVKVKSAKARRAKRQNTPKVHYVQTQTSVSVSYPPNMEVPIPAQKAPEVPKRVLCSVEGCQNVKRYSCSKTQKPLCSLKCYKKNLATLNPVPVSVAD